MPSGGHNRINFKHTEETKKLIGISSKGRNPWNKDTKGIMKKNSGSFKKGNQNWKKRKKQDPWNKGKKIGKMSEKIKKKISKSLKGKKSYRYIDGRSYDKSPHRYGDDWDKIRFLIYERDNFTCQDCGKRMSKIVFDVHHKIPFLVSFDNSLSNLITLCRSCHMKREVEIIKKLKRGSRLKL